MPLFPTPDAPVQPAPVRCGADALRIISLAVSRPLEAETLVFLLDQRGLGGVITLVSGTTEPDSVLAVAECLARAAEGVDRARAMVLATVRPAAGPGGALLPGDVDRWLEASDVVGERGVHLLEWFVIGPAGAECPRDLLGEPQRWHLLGEGGEG